MTRTERLDAFTDAAFAFAVSLMVIGGARAPVNFEELLDSLGDVPAFAVGFAIMGLFWWSHVRWRRMRGEGDTLSVLLTLLLIFLTLVYVQPLRGMASAVGVLLTGSRDGYSGDLADLFAVYGTGFVAMSLTMAALFFEGNRDKDLSAGHRRDMSGEGWIWIILALTGVVSILISMTRYGVWAAMAYSTLPITVNLFVRRWNWSDRGSEA